MADEVVTEEHEKIKPTTEELISTLRRDVDEIKGTIEHEVRNQFEVLRQSIETIALRLNALESTVTDIKNSGKDIGLTRSVDSLTDSVEALKTRVDALQAHDTPREPEMTDEQIVDGYLKKYRKELLETPDGRRLIIAIRKSLYE